MAVKLQIQNCGIRLKSTVALTAFAYVHKCLLLFSIRCGSRPCITHRVVCVEGNCRLYVLSFMCTLPTITHTIKILTITPKGQKKNCGKGAIFMFQNTLYYRGPKTATAFSHIQVKERCVVMVCIVKNAQSLKGLLTDRHNDLPVF